MFHKGKELNGYVNYPRNKNKNKISDQTKAMAVLLMRKRSFWQPLSSAVLAQSQYFCIYFQDILGALPGNGPPDKDLDIYILPKIKICLLQKPTSG